MEEKTLSELATKKTLYTEEVSISEIYNLMIEIRDILKTK